jgi:hypothetical protein
MSRRRSSRRDRAAVGESPPDLFVVPGPWPRLGRPVKHDDARWCVIDDWPAYVPVTGAETDVFEAWFDDLFDLAETYVEPGASATNGRRPVF